METPLSEFFRLPASLSFPVTFSFKMSFFPLSHWIFLFRLSLLFLLREKSFIDSGMYMFLKFLHNQRLNIGTNTQILISNLAHEAESMMHEAIKMCTQCCG